MLDYMSDGSSVTQESGSDYTMDGPPVIEEYTSQHTLVGSGYIIPIDFHGDFVIRIVTSGRVDDGVDAAFKVRRDTLAHRCPALIDGAEGNTKFFNVPFITFDFEEAMETILVNLHADPPKTCLSTTCLFPDECLGPLCDGILPIRVWYWIARMTWELRIILRGITEELLLEWAEFQLPGIHSTDMTQFEDWYLLGPIALYMGSHELARYFDYVIQNQCFVLGPPESETSRWVLGQDGPVVYFGEEDDWPCYDPCLEMMLGKEISSPLPTPGPNLVDLGPRR
ncbi:hypothetical protein IMZ48_15950 [Candidatus Bathyarchaeota archaeon]|nr:hypothetical protein [Candidatus Bathyarchaeota archaeon]